MNEVNSGLQIVDVLQGVPVNISAIVILKLVSVYVHSCQNEKKKMIFVPS